MVPIQPIVEGSDGKAHSAGDLTPFQQSQLPVDLGAARMRNLCGASLLPDVALSLCRFPTGVDALTPSPRIRQRLEDCRNADFDLSHCLCLNSGKCHHRVLPLNRDVGV